MSVNAFPPLPRVGRRIHAVSDVLWVNFTTSRASGYDSSSIPRAKIRQAIATDNRAVRCGSNPKRESLRQTHRLRSQLAAGPELGRAAAERTLASDLAERPGVEKSG